jgi:hypothetical protein
MTEQIINSYNLFVDSDNSLTGTGTEFQVSVGNAGVNCAEGQMIRVSLMSFNMYKNFYAVNPYNNELVVRTDIGATTINLTEKNYKTIGDIATDLANKVKTALDADAPNVGAFEITSVAPTTNTTIDDTSDRIISILLTFKNGGSATAHGLSSCILQSFSSVGDSAILLGGNRIEDPADTTTSSYNVVVATNTITITGYYPAQRSTEEHIYLRTDLPNNSLETQSLSSGRSSHSTEVLSSDILAKIPIDHEFAHFEASTGREFFLNLTSKNVNTMRFYLRDARDRELPVAGTGTAQKTLGNLHASFVLRFDIIQQYNIGQLQTPPIPRNIPARKIGVIENLDNRYD